MVLVAFPVLVLTTITTSATSHNYVDAWIQHHQYQQRRSYTGTTIRPIYNQGIRLSGLQKKKGKRFRCINTRSSTVLTLSSSSSSTSKIASTAVDNESLLSEPEVTERRLVLTMYNSRTRQKEIFVSQEELLHRKQQEINEGNDETLSTQQQQQKKYTVTMYTCGPTVYDYAHIGNFRAFLTYDLLKRILLYLGYNVIHICNITDVDDKIIKKANQLQVPIGQIQSTITEYYTKEFFNDLQSLSCIPATYYPRATNHIPAMIRFIQDLAIPITIQVPKDTIRTTGASADDNSNVGDVETITIPPLAYETEDGSWYYDTQMVSSYGTQLVNINYNDMEQQKEFVENVNGKKHFADFCLWKAYKENVDRIDSIWSSNDYVNNTNRTDISSTEEISKQEQMYVLQQQQQPYPKSTLPTIQRGRPGWHLECSAMAQTYFGTSSIIDFHGGGIDLKFPHHENEIAQSIGLKYRNQFQHYQQQQQQTSTTQTTSTNGKLHTLPKLKENDTSTSNYVNEEDLLFCNCWFHNGFVNMGNEKMSKSLGNFITLNDACPTKMDQRAYRYFIVTSQYRNPLSYTEQSIQACKKSLQRIDKVKGLLDQLYLSTLNNDTITSSPLTDNGNSNLSSIVVPKEIHNFEMAIIDDLSMPRAIAALFNLIKVTEQEMKKDTNERDVVGLLAIRNAVLQMDQVFGILEEMDTSSSITTDNDTVDNTLNGNNNESNIPAIVLQLVQDRIQAKMDKDFTLADTIRQQILTEYGYVVKDVKGGGEPIITPVEE